MFKVGRKSSPMPFLDGCANSLVERLDYHTEFANQFPVNRRQLRDACIERDTGAVPSKLNQKDALP